MDILLPKTVQRGYKKKKDMDTSDGTPDDGATEILETFEATFTSDSVDPSLKKGSKTPKSKKARRSPNAFLLFASERRKTIPADNKTPGHVSQILGGMWKNLPLDEKEKYIMEARRLGALHKIDSQGYVESPSETVKMKKCKSELKCKPIKKVSEKKNRGPTTKKILRSSFSAATESNKKIMVPEKKDEVVGVARQSAAEAAAPAEGPRGESKVTTDHSCTSGNSSVPATSFSNTLESLCQCRHSPYQQPIDRYADISVRTPMFGTGMNMPYFGAGLSQSLFPQNPLADISFWMYRQSFFQNPYNFPPSVFSTISNPYSSIPYPPYSPYSSLYSSSSYAADRFYGQMNSIPKPCCSAAAAANAVIATTATANGVTRAATTTSVTRGETVISMTRNATTTMTHGDEEEQDNNVNVDSDNLLIVDDEGTELPEEHE